MRRVMTAEKLDRRTERTRKALKSAFIELTLTRGYDAVTVEDIVARADIGRSTFYMHYAGKEEILTQTMRTPSSPLAGIVGGRTPPETLLPILSHFREQRKINRAFFVSPMRPIWVRCLAELIEPRLAALARETRARPVVPQRLIALHIAEAQLALVANWLMGNAACSAEALAEALVASTNAIVTALMRDAVTVP
jgi:AcrR family transcriptional regulator